MAFLDRLSTLLRGEPAASAKHDDLQLAVAALLVEAAKRDDVFDDVERGAIERILTEYFDLTPEETQELFAAATQASATSGQLFGFTNKVVKDMDEAGRIKVIEMLWEVAYADGVLDPNEDAMIRRVAGLIFVSDHDRAAARRRAREKLGLGA